MLEFGTLTNESAGHGADSRMHQAGVLAVLGVFSIVGFFGIAWLAQVSSLDGHPGCGLLLAAFAAILFPTATIAFCTGSALSVSALSQDRALITMTNVGVAQVNAAGASVFGVFLFGMFFGRLLI